jgi:hypothetical protein
MVFSVAGNPNILSKISFCDKECSNVNDNKTKGQIVDFLDTKYKLQVIAKDYTFLNPNIMRNVSFHQHILTTYTNGNPYMLYLTKVDGVNSCIYIDKKLKTGYTFPKMHCVKYRFDDTLFENETIFTGELIRDIERRWFFLIDNILIYKGMSTADKNILARFELIHNILNNEYVQDKFLEICPLQVKKLFLYKNVKYMFEEYIPLLSYPCKGVIFYTMNNRHTNYAYIIQRENQIPVKSSGEIDEIVEEKYPELWNKKNQICDNHIDDDNNSDSSDNIISETQSQLQPMDMSNVNNITPTTANIVIGDQNIVFRILKTEMPDIYNLYFTTADNNLVKHSIALVPNIKVSRFLHDAFKTNPNCIAMNAECKYSSIFEKWTPIRIVDEIKPYTQLQVENIEKIVKNE